ncbi:hypothetical protein QE152_g4941 [Popillia japonica]|uniref:Uncharacterized protein n=1 Tax=Popillia japonica TaxID=7064 RepID=A0AAW1MYQ2_POPJA
MRSLLDKAGQRILYTLYRLNEDYSGKNIKFYSIGFNSFNEKGLVLPGAKMSDKFDLKHAFIVNLPTLESLESVHRLKISFLDEEVWCQCRKCLKTSDTSFCSNCRRPMYTRMR